MLTLHIDDPNIETIFTQGFEGSKEKFLSFIKSAYKQKVSIEAFEADKERFMRTYEKMQNGTMPYYSEEEANEEIERFLTTL